MNTIYNWSAKRSGSGIRVYGCLADGQRQSIQVKEIQANAHRVTAIDEHGEAFELSLATVKLVLPA